jgi:phage antirepressor YoqD-like protein
VDFYGQALTVIDREGKPYVAMRQIVEGMTLAWPPQFKKLTDEPDRWGTVTMMVTVQSADGKERDMVCIPLKKLTGWLMTLQPSRMDEAVAAKVLTYQNECDDALWAYWSRGVAVNPRAISLDAAPDFDDAIAVAEAWIAQKRARMAAEAQAKQLSAKVEADAPKVTFAEQLAVSKGTILIGDLAKLITAQIGYKIGQQKLFEVLRERGDIMRAPGRDLLPSQKAVEAGWLVVRESTREGSDGGTYLTRTTRVTGKGQAHYLAVFARLVALPRLPA